MATGPIIGHSARQELLAAVEGHIEEVHRELAVQLKRMTQLQLQVNEARDAIRELTGSE